MYYKNRKITSILLALSLSATLLSGCELNVTRKDKKTSAPITEEQQDVASTGEGGGESFLESLGANLSSENIIGVTKKDDETKNDSSSDSQTVDGYANATFTANWNFTSDGDTIKIAIDRGTKATDGRVLDGGVERVRLLLVDTPESVHSTIKPQLYGVQASDFTKSIQKQNEQVKIEVGNPSRDDYGRLLAYVYLNDGTMLNKLLVEKGYARVAYIFPPNTKYLDQLQSAQKVAKSQKLRIWSIDNYVTDKGFDMDVVENEHYNEAIQNK